MSKPHDTISDDEFQLAVEYMTAMNTVPVKFTDDEEKRQRLQAMFDQVWIDFCKRVGRLQ
jgi:hypothetical protein